MDLDPVLLSRLQFAWVIGWHILMPAFTIGMASYIAILEGMHLLTGQAARKAVDKLIRAGLLEEVRAAGSLPVWRRDDDSGPIALRITKLGLEAIDVEDETVAAPKEASVRPAPARGEIEPAAVPPENHIRA